jgi:hypothetical protein
LPIDERGFPVPYFVAIVDGKPDHRIIDPVKHRRCIWHRLCWICGTPLTAFDAFTVGPMCGINRISAEPPAHRSCAEYSVRACPFLSRPHAHRREAGMPEEPLHKPGGVMLEHNPGVSLVWVSRTAKPFDAGNGVLYAIGEPTSLAFYAEGRPATRAEVERAVALGLPKLLEADPPNDDAARAAFDSALGRFLHLLDKHFGATIADGQR